MTMFVGGPLSGLPVITDATAAGSHVSMCLTGIEAEPNGKGAHDPGAKLDAGKNRLGLVLGSFARSLWAVGEVGTYGANKYSPNGWIAVPDGVARYTDALYRHLLKEAIGEERDADTDLLHAAHAAWNAMARLDLMLRAREARHGGTTH